MDDSSTDPSSEESSQAPDMVFAKQFSEEEYITCIASSTDNWLFCGRKNGLISVYDATTGAKSQDLRLYQSDYAIKHLEWCSNSKLLISVNAANRYIVSQLTLDNRRWVVKDSLMDQHAYGPVSQLLIERGGSAILISTGEVAELRESTGSLIKTLTYDNSEDDKRWITHPKNPELLIFFQRGFIHLYTWRSLQMLTSEKGIDIALDGSFTGFEHTWANRSDCGTLINTYGIQTGSSHSIGFALLDMSTVDIANPDSTPTTELTPTCFSKNIDGGIKRILGLHKSSLLFIDGRGWVCSALKGFRETETYTRHFFIPSLWMIGGDLLVKLTSKNRLLIAHGEQLLVFQGCLKLEEQIIHPMG